MNNTDPTKLEHILRSLKQDAGSVPTDTFRTNARIRVLNTLSTKTGHAWLSRPRIFGYTVGTALAAAALSVGTVFAAQSSLPNSTLYPLKVLSERAALSLSPTASLKTTVASSIISRRVDEIEQAQKQGDKQKIDASIANLDDEITELQKRTDIPQGTVETVLTEHREFISTLKNHDGENKNEERTLNQQPKESGDNTSVPVETTPHTLPSPTVVPDIQKPQVEGASVETKSAQNSGAESTPGVEITRAAEKKDD